jgi:glutathione S-transferase
LEAISRAAGGNLPVLWQMTSSIFCEKARWALAFKGIPHRQKNLLPGLHGLTLTLHRRGRTVPVLDLEGASVRDSTAIIAALEKFRPEPSLYPRGEAERRAALELEDFFDEHLGHEVRRVALDSILEEPELAVQSFFADSPRWLRLIGRSSFPIGRRMTRRRYGVNELEVDQARRKILVAIDRVEATLGAGGYLVGDDFTVADLTGACLLAPLVRPPEYPNPVQNTAMPARLQEVVEWLSTRDAAEWVREMYQRHRAPSAAVRTPGTP